MDKYLHLATTLLNNGHIEEALTVLRHNNWTNMTKQARQRIPINNSEFEDELQYVSKQQGMKEVHAVLNIGNSKPSITIYFTLASVHQDPKIFDVTTENIERWAFGVWGRSKVSLDSSPDEIVVYVRLDK